MPSLFAHLFALLRALLWGTFPTTPEIRALARPHNAFASITPSTSLQWSPCLSDADKGPFRSVECARLIVPLDYSKPSSESSHAILAIIKLGAQPQGSSASADAPVFFNPGGPGGDLVEEFLSGAAARVWAKYAPSSDIIGIVPRAVGSTFPAAGCYKHYSSRVARLTELVFNQELGYTNASINIMEVNAVGFGLDCAGTSADVLPYMGTVNTVQDMNHVLTKLGRTKLRFVGFSYGTVLGATFAAMFPNKVERMVLDGTVFTVHDSNDWFSNAVAPEREIVDVDVAFDNFFVACFAAGPDLCSIWRSGGSSEIRSIFLEADSRIHQRPINVPEVGLFQFPRWRYAVYRALFLPSLTFRNLAQLISEVYNGTAGDAIAGVLQTQSKSGRPEDPPLVDPQTQLSNGIESIWTVQCLDRGLIGIPAETQEPRAIFEQYRAVSAIGRNNAYYDIICNNFLVRSNAKLPGQFKNISTNYPILFMGNTADPTTPLRSAVSMSRAFPGSRVLVINGTGHTSVFAGPSLNCSPKWIAPYIVNGSLPPEGTSCQATENPFLDSWNDISL